MLRAILDFPARDGAPGDRPSRRLAFDRPVRVLQAARLEDVRAVVREAAADAAGRWAVGFVAYEAAPAFDDALVTRPPLPGLPLAWFAIFDRPRLDRADAGAADPEALLWSTRTARPEYDRAVAHVREAIAAGVVYQVNHTLRFRTRFDIEPRTVYERLVASRHGLYHALIEADDWAIVSASPELFLDIRDGHVSTRPMKGTMRRGRWLEEDRDARDRLERSAKDRAENLMITDLLRNDLGRVAGFGSVTVPAAFAIETYPTVHQMTSTVTARLRDGVTLDDVFAATFPCGSVTGAPKVTAMRTIAALETEPRGVYCGAVGLLRPDGSATFSVGIRTIMVDARQHTAVYGSGGGITWDSRADSEYDELIAKAALLTDSTPAFDLVETMRMEDGRIVRLDLHLRRLRDSAEYWGFSADTAVRAQAALAALSREQPHGCWRVRLTAAPDGTIAVSHAALPSAFGERDSTAAPRTVVLSPVPVSSADRLLFHKTTARDAYTQRRVGGADVFDTLLCNERGEVTEFTIGNVVAETGGALLTPPRGCGLLAGCMRAELLRDGTIRERVLTPADLRSADRLWFINSVRGWVPVRLADPDEEKGRAP